jgi:hypothetical protein
MSIGMTWPDGSSGSGVNRDDSDDATDEDPGGDRTGGWKEGHRFAGAVVRRETAGRSIYMCPPGICGGIRKTTVDKGG